MALDMMFPTVLLTTGELAIVAEQLKHPVVQKYLLGLGANSISELASMSLAGKPAEDIVRIHARVQGRLETVNTLISITSTITE